MALTRRIFIAAGGLVILGGAAFGGSAIWCARGRDAAALPLDRLDVALGDIREPGRIARAWRAAAGGDETAAELLRRPAILEAMVPDCPETRRGLIRAGVRAEFAAGDTVVADRLIVARSEALIAALRWRGA